MKDLESNPVESTNSTKMIPAGMQGWIKVGAIAAASALAGGLAAAWYYRKTLDTLRQVESNSANSDFGVHEDTADPTADNDT
jgi:hypothetical protein